MTYRSYHGLSRPYWCSSRAIISGVMPFAFARSNGLPGVSSMMKYVSSVITSSVGINQRTRLMMKPSIRFTPVGGDLGPRPIDVFALA